MKMQAFFQKLLHNVNDLLLPQTEHCHTCGRIFYYDDGCFCDQCLAELESFRFSAHSVTLKKPPLEACAAAYHYGGPAKTLVTQLKFNADFACAQPLAYAMSAVLLSCGWEQQMDLMIPVPLHERRYRERGFNQCTLLAEPIGACLHIPVSEDALKRIRYTGTQVKRSGAERRTALLQAFKADEGQVKGKRILLVDDVFTTGSTGIACAEALLEAGATGVWMITACRA